MNTAPDLKNGSIVNGDASDPVANIWATEIQCVLQIDDKHTQETYYLSHECLNEHVPFSAAYDRGQPEIFMANKPGEFLTYSDGRFFTQLECPPYVFRNSLGVPQKITLPFLMVHERPLKMTMPSQVACPLRTVSTYDPKAAITALQDGELSMRDVFLRVVWHRRATRYKLFAPCRYVNFSPKSAPKNYLQPISGTVLIQENDHLFPAYVACAWSNDSEIKVEFALPRYHPAENVVAEHYGMTGEIRANFGKVSSFAPIFCRRWDAILKVDGEFSLYAYD